MACLIAASYSGASLAVAVGLLIASSFSVYAMVRVTQVKGSSDEIAERDREIVRLERQLEQTKALLADCQAQVLRLYERLFAETGKAP